MFTYDNAPVFETGVLPLTRSRSRERLRTSKKTSRELLMAISLASDVLRSKLSGRNIKVEGREDYPQQGLALPIIDNITVSLLMLTLRNMASTGVPIGTVMQHGTAGSGAE